jgi:hypothetical protein
MTGHSFSPDGSRIAVTYGSWSDRPDNNAPSVAVLFDTATGRRIGESLRHDDDVFSPCYAPNGKWFLTVSDDRTVRRWDGQTGTPIGEPIRLPLRQRFAQVSPNSQLIVTGSGHMIDASRWRVIKKLRPDAVLFRHAFFSPDGVWLATVSDRWSQNDEGGGAYLVELRQWDVQNAVQIADSIDVPADKVTEIDSLGDQVDGVRWLDQGRSIALGPNLTWQCTLPCAVESILPFLRECRPLILGETGEQTINHNCSLDALNLEHSFPNGRMPENECAYDLAERVLIRSHNGSQNPKKSLPQSRK